MVSTSDINGNYAIIAKKILVNGYWETLFDYAVFTVQPHPMT